MPKILIKLRKKWCFGLCDRCVASPPPTLLLYGTENGFGSNIVERLYAEIVEETSARIMEMIMQILNCIVHRADLAWI